MLETEIDSFRPRFQEAGLTLDLIRHGNGPWRVQADEQRLSQSFRNLLRNSLRYTDSGGRVRVTLQGSAKGPALDFDDIAPGVPADALPKLFKRLCRVERSRSRSTGGAGLGLAIARNIVEAHGGTIGAEPASTPLSLDEGSLRVRADGRETELTAGRVRSRRLNL